MEGTTLAEAGSCWYYIACWNGTEHIETEFKWIVSGNDAGSKQWKI